MPSRVVRGDINRSASLSRVSMEAELTFDRLLTAADDYGRLDARPEALKADLFPMRVNVTPDMVLSWVRELASGSDAPVALYEVHGRPYLALVNWEKHRGTSKRSAKSRYPGPPENYRGNPGTTGYVQGEPESPGNPSGGMESRVESRESREEESPRAPRSVHAPVQASSDHPRKLNGKSLMPARLAPDDADRLKRLAKPLGLTEDQIRHGCRVVRDWSHGSGKARRDWVLVIVNALRDGWALKGYKPPVAAHVARSSPGWDLKLEGSNG